MAKTKLYFFDTTLRDGQQKPTVEFSLEQKTAIAHMLGDSGIHYVEAGYPGSNPIDTALFDTLTLDNAQMVAFGMTKRAGMSASNDPGLASLVHSKAPIVCLVAKAWDFHVTKALGITLDEALDNLKQSVHHTVAQNKESQIDLEHFFDGYKDNPQFAVASLKTALNSGAKWVTLCDTNGGMMPRGIRRTIESVLQDVPEARGRLGIHCHNDTGQATANTLAAIEAGCTLVQGTINGLGERCGNADLLEIIPTLMLKDDYRHDFDCQLPEEALSDVFPKLRKMVAKLSGVKLREDQPYYGIDAFATKAGIHASGLIKGGDASYSHVPPARLGQRSKILISRQNGRSCIPPVLDELGIDYHAKQHLVDRLYDTIMEQSEKGYSYVYALASFELLAREVMGEDIPPFTIHNANITTNITFSDDGSSKAPSKADIKATFMGKVLSKKQELGNGGPVDALNACLVTMMDTIMDPTIAKSVQLVGFDQHNLSEGVDSKVATQITFEGEINGHQQEWTTIGVSSNSTLAALEAMKDCYRWVVMKKQWQSGFVYERPGHTAAKRRRDAGRGLGTLSQS